MAIVKSTSSLGQANDRGDSSPGSGSFEDSDDSSGDLSDSTSDSDSAMGSDLLGLSEIGEAGTELCQAGTELCQVVNHTISLPLDLYDLPDLTPVLNLETWNGCLSEEERFSLSEFLPDMDQETFARTLKELFSGKNFHFGCPISDLFTKLKAGALDPRIVLHRRGLNSFKKREHYHLLRKYQNSMVGSFRKIRDAWRDCSGYGIEERLQLLNILRSRRSLGDADGVVSETDSESGDSAEELWGRRTEMEHGPRKSLNDNAKGILKVKNESSLLEEKGKARKGLLGFPTRTADGYNEEDEDEMMADQCYEMDTRSRLLRPGKKESHVGLPSERKSRGVNQGVTVASYNPHSLETMSKARYSGKDWMYQPKDLSEHQLSVGSLPVKSEEWNVRGKKFKSEDDFRSGTSKAGFDPKVSSYNKALPAQIGDPYSYFDHRAKMSQDKVKNIYAHDGRIGTGLPRGNTAFSQSEDTESDSSDQVEEDADAYSFGRKVDHLSSAMEEGQQVKSASDFKSSSKLARVDIQMNSNILLHELRPFKAKQTSKMNEPSYLQDVVLVKKNPVPCPSEKVQQLSLKANAAEKKRKGSTNLDHFSEPLPRDYGSSMKENEEYFAESSQYLDSRVQDNGSGNKSNMPLLMCNSAMKKWKGKVNDSNHDDMEEAVYLQYSPMQQVDGPNFIKKKAKRKVDATSLATPDPIMPEQGAEDVEPEAKLQKKTFTLITPTKHTGFSFSIIHLLSAVRKAMITPMEDVNETSNHLEKGDDGLKKENIAVNETPLNKDSTASKVAGQNNLPSLTVQDIVNRVRTNPGDPCILETQEPIQDLVRGVLKIFSSKTAPLGAKGWKVLVLYEKSNKSWCWVGPISSSSSDNDAVEEETSSEAWGIPHKMLVKLVDAFANWLKSGQETLRQIGSLPAPPIVMLPELDEKERFRDLRAQKSLNTISASSEEVRAYFRKEELLRYLIPDRAFSYTAADGKKSIVAPLRRGGGKPTSKARDHFMLKPDRPPHVTILCLVRDAAARLPGSIGTRADVCTLIRDSQYIVEAVTDAQVNQVASGALDRLHYERDPCVQFDSERKLWVYLHRDREEEDFEDDGTSSTKKWKRQRKDATDQSNTEATNDVSYHATGDPTGGGLARFDFNPDLNVDSSSLQAGLKSEPMYNGLRSNMENFQLLIDQSAGYRGQENPMGWEALGPLNAFRENKMLCQENSAKDDFSDKLFVEKDQLEF